MTGDTGQWKSPLLILYTRVKIDEYDEQTETVAIAIAVAVAVAVGHES